jgi:hypothetical protein
MLATVTNTPAPYAILFQLSGVFIVPVVQAILIPFEYLPTKVLENDIDAK